MRNMKLEVETHIKNCWACKRPLTIVVAADGQCASPTWDDMRSRRIVCEDCSREYEMDGGEYIVKRGDYAPERCARADPSVWI